MNKIVNITSRLLNVVNWLYAYDRNSRSLF